MDVRRGDLIVVALQGDQGKPRPALVVQADRWAALPAVTVLPLTGTLVEASLLRVRVEPAPATGLTRASQIMVDRPQTLARSKIGGVIGRLDPASMAAVGRSMAVFFDLG